MNILKLTTAAAVVATSLVASSAGATGVKTVGCEGIAVGLAEVDRLAIQEKTGAGAAFEKAVCDAARNIPASSYGKSPTQLRLTVQPSGYEMIIIIWDTTDDKK